MKILDKYIELIEKGYCDDCNELNCIDNYPHKKIVQEIKELQQENQQLKEMQCPFLGTGCKSELEQLKKQKDDVVEAIKGILEVNEIYKTELKTAPFYSKKWVEDIFNDLLRMLGEIDG